MTIYSSVGNGINDEVFYLKVANGGATIATTYQTIIFGDYSLSAGQTSGGASAAVENLATYLRDSGY